MEKSFPAMGNILRLSIWADGSTFFNGAQSRWHCNATAKVRLIDAWAPTDPRSTNEL
jgi:hypothetical protein